MRDYKRLYLELAEKGFPFKVGRSLASRPGKTAAEDQRAAGRLMLQDSLRSTCVLLAELGFTADIPVWVESPECISYSVVVTGRK